MKSGKKRSHILSLLTDLLSECKGSKKHGKEKFHWDDEHQQAFNNMKKIIAHDITLAYPNFSKPFELYTDARKQQLGAVIMQDNCPLVFYSHKLNTAQCNYTTTERELLSIVECCNKFR